MPPPPGGPGAPAGRGQRRDHHRPPFHGRGALTAAQQHAIITAIDAQPGTLHYLTQAADNLSLPGLGNANGGAQITAYGGGDPAWSGLVLISGGWYSQSPGVREIDVNTLFLTDTNTAVGDTYTMVNGTHKVTAKIVGEVFAAGQRREHLHVAGHAHRDRPDGHRPGQYAVSLKPGVNADDYAVALQNALGDSYFVGTGGGGQALIAITTLVAMLTLLIIAVAGLGVLNTVALQVREKAHDIGIFKALGMTPRQTLTHGGLLGRRHRPRRGHHRGPGRHPAAPQRAPGDGPRGQLRHPGVGDVGVLAAGDGAARPGWPGHRHRRRAGAGLWAARSRTATALRTE